MLEELILGERLEVMAAKFILFLMIYGAIVATFITICYNKAKKMTKEMGIDYKIDPSTIETTNML